MSRYWIHLRDVAWNVTHRYFISDIQRVTRVNVNAFTWKIKILVT